jgi:AcrR family transcriptional regulator
LDVSNRKQRKVGAKGAGTRRLLLESAAELFLSKGIGATSLDQIAAAAGVTKGAIYDHFDSKTDLVFELFEARGSPILGALQGDRSGAAQLKLLLDFLLSSMPTDLDYVTSQNEYNHYISSDPGRVARFRKLARESLNGIAARLEETVGPDLLPLSPAETAIALSALHSGLLFHRLIAPELVTEEVASRIFERILGTSSSSR